MLQLRAKSTKRAGFGTALGLAMALCVPNPSAARPQVSLSTCGQTVPVRAVATLAADLDCAGTAVTLENGSELELNGHTVAGTTNVVVVSGRRASIVGPGRIETGVGGTLVFAGYARVSLRDLELHNGRYGVRSLGGRRSRVDLENILVQGTEIPAEYPGVLRATNVQINGTLDGLAGRSLRGRNLTIDVPQRAILGRRVRLEDSTISNGENGVRATIRARLDNVTISGQSDFGVHAPIVRISGSVTGSGAGDIATLRPPRMRDPLACETSVVLDKDAGGNVIPSAESWGICALD